MCGLAGLIHSSKDFDENLFSQMLEPLHHRGPDQTGIWSGDGITLGHKRLSIIDLSDHGKQPMESACGRYVLAYNGEIYNYLQIKEQLDASFSISWRGHSDSEILLNALVKLGIEETLRLANGMFAFALWDKQEKELLLARDRFGEKPLYYSKQESCFLFASELTAIEACPNIALNIDRAALKEYFRCRYFPAPLSVYQEVKKLEPGHFLRFKNNRIEKSCYWNLSEKATDAMLNGFEATENEAINALDAKLSEAVKMRMHADVPLGAFLSGGIDSSIVCALMAKASKQKVQTFSIGFDVPGFNEAEFAKEVAAHIGSEHTEHYVSGEDALDVVPLLGAMYDEPFADPSQIPTYLVSKMAREHVTVCLSGDGGDELFGGYERYQAVEILWNKMKRVPLPLRRFIALSLKKLPLSLLRVLMFPFSSLLKKFGKQGDLALKARRLAEWVQADSFESLYRVAISAWPDPDEVVKKEKRKEAVEIWQPDAPSYASKLSTMCFKDMHGYLPGDILTKVDRATMSVSLEGRIPLLDHELAEFALMIPAAMKFKEGKGKYILRKVLYRYVPENLVERPKMGFGVPLGSWLSGPLKAWAQDLLNKERLQREGYLNAETVERIWQEHQEGVQDHSARLWTVLMFQSWLDVRKST